MNIASRMESTAMANMIHITEFTANKLTKAGYKVKSRGVVKVKGKGDMPTFWLIGNGRDTVEEGEEERQSTNNS